MFFFFFFFFKLSKPSSGAMALEVYSACNRNQYQDFSWDVKRCRRIRLTISLASVSRLSGKCGILDLSQVYRPPRPATGIIAVVGSRHSCYLRDRRSMVILGKW
jgi:hypothetical protein